MSIVDTAKDLYELLGKGANLDLQTRLMKLREEALALQEENLALKQEVSEMRNSLDLRENMEFENRVYWLIDGESRDGPFCQRCYDVDGRCVRLQDNGWASNDGTVPREWQCLSCHAFYPA